MTSALIIRRFEKRDEGAVRRLCREGTMFTVNRCFWHLATSEMMVHVLLLIAACSFVALNISLITSLLIPMGFVILIFVVVYFGHLYKALFLEKDLHDIESSYNPRDRKGFWVAEVRGDISSDGGEKLIAEEGEGVPSPCEEGEDSKNVVVGTVAIDVKRDPDHQDKPMSVAWLRRMTVRRDMRKRGVASQLVQCAVRHCEKNDFVAIELITTQFHLEARQLYDRKGFQVVKLVGKHFVMGLLSFTNYWYRRQIK